MQVYILTCKLTSDFNGHVFCDQDVLALQISVDDILTVAVSNSCRDASHDESCFGLWHVMDGIHIVQKISIFRHLEHEVGLIWSLNEAIYSKEIRVSKLLKSLHLSR